MIIDTFSSYHIVHIIRIYRSRDSPFILFCSRVKHVTRVQKHILFLSTHTIIHTIIHADAFKYFMQEDYTVEFSIFYFIIRLNSCVQSAINMRKITVLRSLISACGYPNITARVMLLKALLGFVLYIIVSFRNFFTTYGVQYVTRYM